MKCLSTQHTGPTSVIILIIKKGKSSSRKSRGFGLVKKKKSILSKVSK